MWRFKTVFLIVIVFALVSFLFICCENNKNLSRSEAEKLIEMSRSEIKEKVCLHEKGVQVGLEHNLWSQQKNYFTTNTVLSNRGSEFFREISGSFLKLRKLLEIKAQVTGIADAVLPLTDTKGVKEAQFVWSYVKIPSPVKWVITDGGKGKAYFRLYDDGWRLEGFDNIIYNDFPIQLSSNELKEENLDRQVTQKKMEELQRAETERIKMEEDMREREKARLTQLIMESKRPSKTIGSFKCVNTSLGIGERPQANGQAILTDVDVSYVHLKTDVYGNVTKKINVVFWFGNISRIYQQDNPPEYRVTFDLKEIIELGPGHHASAISFNDKQIRDNFNNNILAEKARWDKKYPELTAASPTPSTSPVAITVQHPGPDYNQIQVGMPSAKVQQIMGNPASIEQKGAIIEWKYLTPKKVEIKMQNDQVVGIERH